METPNFQVVVGESSISPDDWVRASAAQGSELPELTAEQKRVAHGFKISEEEYARGELARLYGQERMRTRAERLGQIAEHMLAALSSEYRLLAITSEMTKARWVLTIQTPDGATNVFAPRDVADDVLDWGAREVMEDFRSRLGYGLGKGRAGRKDAALMDVRGQIVRFYLSSRGRLALKGLVPSTGSFQALVMETENLGLSVWRLAERAKPVVGPVPVLLLKWDYIATMAYNYQIKTPPAKAQPGFLSRDLRAKGKTRSYRKQD